MNCHVSPSLVGVEDRADTRLISTLQPHMRHPAALSFAVARRPLRNRYERQEAGTKSSALTITQLYATITDTEADFAPCRTSIPGARKWRPVVRDVRFPLAPPGRGWPRKRPGEGPDGAERWRGATSTNNTLLSPNPRSARNAPHPEHQQCLVKQSSSRRACRVASRTARPAISPRSTR